MLAPCAYFWGAPEASCLGLGEAWAALGTIVAPCSTILHHSGLVLGLLGPIRGSLGLTETAKISESQPARSEGRRFTYFWGAPEASCPGLGAFWAALGDI